MTNTKSNSLACIESALLTLGWVEGAPSALAASADREACNQSACEVCGNLGLDYNPWRRPGGRGYKAFAVCACGHVQEF